MNEPGDELIFQGLRVLDVGTWIAGPVTATILADYGADVIKVEPPGGDAYRRYPQSGAAPKAAENYVWIVDARNKRSISLDLRTEAGREVLVRLIKWCDVYVTNQPFPTRRSLRVTYEDIAHLNERMIYASLSVYGEQGPDRDGEGFDAVAWWARSGLMDMVRDPGAPVGWSAPAMGDHPTSVSLFASILLALMRREKTGRGGLVHTNLLANGVWANAVYAQAALVGADFTDAITPPLVPSRTVFTSADGRDVQLYMVRTQEQLDRLFVAIGREDLFGDERFAEPSRAQHYAELIEVLRETFLLRPAAEWLGRFREHGVNAAIVARAQDLVEDPQIHANGIFRAPVDADIPAPYVVNHPLNVEGLRTVGPRRAPGLGEHTAEILAELGYTEGEATALRAGNAVA